MIDERKIIASAMKIIRFVLSFNVIVFS
jgi:hypothetical protein